MSTHWEMLLGDTSRFAVKMAFVEDSSEISLESDLAASWGSFELWVNGANVCAHVEEGERLDAVHWYLLPLLEWLTANWNSMLHEERLPIRNAGVDAVESLYRTRFPPAGVSEDRALEFEQEWYDWRERHALHAARDGGLFPEVFLRRREDKIEVSWSNRTPPGSPDGFNFLAPFGRALLEPTDVASALFGVMRAAVEQLASWQPESTRLATLNTAIGELSKPGRQRASRLDWLLGVPAGAGGDPPWEVARGLFARTSAKIRRAVLEPEGSGLVLRGSSHAVLLFGSVNPTVAADDAQGLARLLVELFDENGDSDALAELVQLAGETSLEGLPWEQGYELAEQVHQWLPPSTSHRRDLDGVLRDLEIEAGTITLGDDHIRGVAVAGPQHRPAAFINESHPRNQREEGRRFTVAHELCHLIADRRIGRKLAVASGPWAPLEVEQRANAFAAYFLMPANEVRAVVAALDEPLTSSAGVKAVADELGTSPRATLEHLHNLGWLDEFERDMLRGTSIDDDTVGRSAVEFGG